MAISGKLETWGGSDNIQLTLSFSGNDFNGDVVIEERIHNPAPVSCKPSQQGVVSGQISANAVAAIQLPGNVSMSVPTGPDGKYTFSAVNGIISGTAKPNSTISLNTPQGNISVPVNAQGVFTSSSILNPPSIEINNNDLIVVSTGGKSFRARFFK